MKTPAVALLLAAVLTAPGVFADAANTLITFSTPGVDKYADGATVLDGERYALVWTAGEAFKGFTTAGEAIDPAQRVLYRAPLAKGGRCPLTLFQIDSAKAPQGGAYAVYLLDTRGSAAEQVVVTGSALAKTYATKGGESNTTSVSSDKTAEGALATSSAGLLDNGLAAPVIKGFKVGDATVKITVANVFPGLAYEVKGGLDKQGAVASEITAKGDNTIELTVDKEAAQFFSIKAK